MAKAEGARRLRLVEGEGPALQGKASQRLRAFKCSPCSDAVGYEFGVLQRVRIGAVEHGGKLKGGAEWWACARCHGPAFLIRRFR